MILTDRTNGRKYQLVKKYDGGGQYYEAATHRRYTLVKQYI